MIKKLVLLAALAFALANTVSASSSFPQYPIPGCYPCGGDGN